MAVTADTARLAGIACCRPSAEYSTGTMLEAPSPTRPKPANAPAQDGTETISTTPNAAHNAPPSNTARPPRIRTTRSPDSRPAIIAAENTA